MERELVAEYETVVGRLLAHLQPALLDAAVELAELPDRVKGFGHVKMRHMHAVKVRSATLLAAFEAAGTVSDPTPINGSERRAA
jgi:indolepyruvate ferredoxin oxidoreductase